MSASTWHGSRVGDTTLPHRRAAFRGIELWCLRSVARRGGLMALEYSNRNNSDDNGKTGGADGA
jgi:hypothetical protein